MYIFSVARFFWRLRDTRGAIVKGGYGHSSIYDPKTQRIYVHGGYHSQNQASYYLSDKLYSYDYANGVW